MNAIAVVPGTAGPKIVERPEPSVRLPDDIKLRVLQVGICGTDREETAGGRALLPAGQSELVIGHEMLGKVVETGSAVTRVKPGDYAVFTVRRGCGKCLPCQINRSDMCQTGEYRERGIWGMDGYQTEFVADSEQYVVGIPPELLPVGVLAEPLSIVEKAIDEAVRQQRSRIPGVFSTPDWLFGRRCLVAGLGPVGLLAAMILRLRGADVYGLDIVPPDSARPQWLAAIGGRYVDGREMTPGNLGECEQMDFIVEAAGVAKLQFELLDALALNGIYVITGIPETGRSLEIRAAELLSRMVLRNQVMMGSVNAARGHFQMAINDLSHANLRWPGLLPRLITGRHPWKEFAGPLMHHQAAEIKEIIEWSQPA